MHRWQQRSGAVVFAADVAEFLAPTWIVWAIVAAAILTVSLCGGSPSGGNPD
jgi:uncharacterized membrane protein